MNSLIEALGQEKRWVNWEMGTKVPRAINGRNASPSDPETWSTYDEVKKVSDNIGIIFTPDQRLLGIDIDHCLENGEIVHEEKERIAELIREADTYTEVSPSETGLHALLLITEGLPLIAKRKGSFEAYTSGRYFTVTCKSYGEEKLVRTVTPDEALRLLRIIGYPWGKKESKALVVANHGEEGGSSPEDDATLLDRMFSAKNGAKVRNLYDGDLSDYSGDDSSADFGFCLHLAFWTRKNIGQIERIWLSSPLGAREKTQKRKDYRDRTIGAAIAACEEIYTAKGGEDGGEPLELQKDPKYYESLLNSIPGDIPRGSLIKELTPLLEAMVEGKELAEAELYIRNEVKTRFGINSKDTDSIVKHFKMMKKKAVEDAERERLEQLRIAKLYAQAEPALNEEQTRVAEDILKSPTLMFDILTMVRKLGIVGEEKNALLHYLILTSGKLEHPLSATVKGDSSAGKSFVLLTTTKLFPESAFYELTDATPQSFYYLPDDHFKHKIIVIFEKHGGERADYSIRTLQSEGKLKIQVPEKNPLTGQFETKIIEKEGPTGFITTTTASVINLENDTRNISMFPDQSPEQTKRVYESINSRYLGGKPISDDEIKPWRHAQMILEQLPIHIPFVRSLSKYLPEGILRTRRDYSHLLAIIETSTLLHQFQRPRVEIDGVTHIRATFADVHIAKAIAEETLSRSIQELPEGTIKVIKAVDQVLIDKGEYDKDGFEVKSSDPFTKSDIAKVLGWDRDTVEKWMNPAINKGYFIVAEEHRGSKAARFRLESGKELPGSSFLPTIEQLIADNPEEATDGVYDPLTGKILILQQLPQSALVISVLSEISCSDAPTLIDA